MLKSIALSLAAFTLAAPVALAQASKEAAAPALKVGMPAPALTVEKWVKGSPVASFEKGKVYVIEFWATWCGPCIGQMPHLSEVQQHYKDKGVTVIGMTSKDERGNTLEAVEKMVKAKGDGMGYSVAWDTGRATNEAFMKAAGQGGIPCSFLVDKQGQIAYIGHPMMLDLPLAEVVAGTWDNATGAEKIAKAEAAMNAVYEAAQDDPKLALTKLAELEKSYPMIAAHMQSMKFQLMMAAEDFDAAYLTAGTIVDKAIASKNASDLNMIAWTIVDPDATWAKRDVDLALRAAVKADEFSGGTDPSILDTLARCHATKGDMPKAIEFQTKAVANAKGKMKEQLQQTLDEYSKPAK